MTMQHTPRNLGDLAHNMPLPAALVHQHLHHHLLLSFSPKLCLVHRVPLQQAVAMTYLTPLIRRLLVEYQAEYPIPHNLILARLELFMLWAQSLPYRLS